MTQRMKKIEALILTNTRLELVVHLVIKTTMNQTPNCLARPKRFDHRLTNEQQ